MISQLDLLIDDILVFNNNDNSKIFNHLKIITLNTSIDYLYLHKYNVIRKKILEIDRSLNRLTNDVGLMNAEYFSRSNAKKIRKNFFEHSNEISNLNTECLEYANQILLELGESLNCIDSIRKKNRISNSILDIKEIIEKIKSKINKHSALVELAKERLPQCITCENCPINCENETAISIIDN